MARTQATGIDVGTNHVRVVVGESQSSKGRTAKRITGLGIAHSKGLRYGYIVNTDDVVRSIREAISQAEKMSGSRISSAYLSIGWVSLEGITTNGSLAISRADSIITEDDVENTLDIAEENLPKQASQNRHVLHVIPTEYKIDGKEAMGRPAGMKGLKLDVKALTITCLDQHLRDLIASVEEAGVAVDDVIAAPIAAGHVNLSKTQKIAGVVLANIGAETVSIVTYENGLPISLKVFPIGSSAITNDIALGLKIPIEEAEEVKRQPERFGEYSKKELDEIIVARLTDIFELIDAHLKKIGRNELLPAGIVLTGGGSGVASISDLAKATLSLPSTIASLDITSTKGSIRDASWSVAYGLCMIGLSTPTERIQGFRGAKKTGGIITRWIRQFLP